MLTCWPAVSLLFAVFALGALFDPARPPFSIESQEFYLVARVALINMAQPIFQTTVTCVLTLVCSACISSELTSKLNSMGRRANRCI